MGLYITVLCDPFFRSSNKSLTAKKRVESILDFQLICHLHSGTKCLHTCMVQTVNNMYQNVSGKSIENQELILRVFFAVHCSAPSPGSLSIAWALPVCTDDSSLWSRSLIVCMMSSIGRFPSRRPHSRLPLPAHHPRLAAAERRK